MNRVAKERALLKRASDRLSGLTTGRMGLSSAGWVESDVDAREAGPGPVSRLRGANPSGRDGVLELRGLCHRRSRRPAQPSLRARPRESPETLRGGFPPHETAEGPRSESGPRDGRGRAPLHLHELWEFRRVGRYEVPPMRRGIRAGTRRDHAGGRGHPPHPPPRPKPTPGPARTDPKLPATPAPTPPPTPARTKPPLPRPPTPVVPERPNPAVPKKTAPVSVRGTIAVPSPPKTRKRTQRSSRMASEKVRRKPPATRRISAETAGSLVVAAAASLLLAGALGQPFLIVSIIAFI